MHLFVVNRTPPSDENVVHEPAVSVHGNLDAGRRSVLVKVGSMLSLTVLLKLGAEEVADSGKPLYASLDDQQKRVFGFLAREMM
jgi:hypothetical protein